MGCRAQGRENFFWDGGNSHPRNYWTILAEEHKRWAIAPYPSRLKATYYERGFGKMMPAVGLRPSPPARTSPARFFFEHGFFDRTKIPEERVPPFDTFALSSAPPAPRPKDRPADSHRAGAVFSLRKGTPLSSWKVFPPRGQKNSDGSIGPHPDVFENVADHHPKEFRFADRLGCRP